MHPFSSLWKHQKTLRFSKCFQGVEKECTGNEWVTLYTLNGCKMKIRGLLPVTLSRIHMIRTEHDVDTPLKPPLYRFVYDMIKRWKKNCNKSKSYHRNTKLTTGKNWEKNFGNPTLQISKRKTRNRNLHCSKGDASGKIKLQQIISKG